MSRENIGSGNTSFLVKEKSMPLKISNELRSAIFQAADGTITLYEFHSFIRNYKGSDSYCDEQCVLNEANSFNYAQPNTHRVFLNVFLRHFEQDEFMAWKVKRDLNNIIEGKGSQQKILMSFFLLGLTTYPFLKKIGGYIFAYEHPRSILSNIELRCAIKTEASNLLEKITTMEVAFSEFRLSTLNFNAQEFVQSTAPYWWTFLDL